MNILWYIDKSEVSSEAINEGYQRRNCIITVASRRTTRKEGEAKNGKINAALFAGVMCYEKKKGTGERIDDKKIRGMGEWWYTEAMLRAINFLQETTSCCERPLRNNVNHGGRVENGGEQPLWEVLMRANFPNLRAASYHGLFFLPWRSTPFAIVKMNHRLKNAVS